MLNGLRAFVALRGFGKLLRRIAVAQERQADALERLATHFAPIAPPVATEASDIDMSFFDEKQALLLEEAAAALYLAKGRPPTDEEVVAEFDRRLPRV